jgi:hypothetical protein
LIAATLLRGHVRQHAVAQDPGVVHEDVQVAECLDRLVDHPSGTVEVGDVVVVGDGLAAGRLDLVDDLLGGCGVGTGAVPAAAAVGDDDLRAIRGEQQRVLAADPAASACDYGDAVLELVGYIGGRANTRPAPRWPSVRGFPPSSRLSEILVRPGGGKGGRTGGMGAQAFVEEWVVWGRLVCWRRPRGADGVVR